MDLPWWEFIVRGGAVYGILLVMVRLSGKRTVGQFTPFDLLVVMLLSEAVSNSLSGGDDSLIGGLLVAATLIAFNVVAAVLSTRSQKVEHLLEGQPVLLGRDGSIFDQVLRAHRVSQGDVEKALREADSSLENMRCLFLEVDGTLSVLQKQK